MSLLLLTCAQEGNWREIFGKRHKGSCLILDMTLTRVGREKPTCTLFDLRIPLGIQLLVFEVCTDLPISISNIKDAIYKLVFVWGWWAATGLFFFFHTLSRLVLHPANVIFLYHIFPLVIKQDCFNIVTVQMRPHSVRRRSSQYGHHWFNSGCSPAPGRLLQCLHCCRPLFMWVDQQ